MTRLSVASLLVVSFFCLASRSTPAEELTSLASPDGRAAITLRLTDGRLEYQVEQRSPGEEPTVVLPWSPLGIEREDQSFLAKLELEGLGREQAVDETYTTVHGKSRRRQVSAKQQDVLLANSDGAKLRVVLRAESGGVAFRYEFPEADETPKTVVGEATGFQLPKGTKAWILPFDNPDQWKPSYENYYENGIAVGTTSPQEAGWAMPALFQVPGGTWVLLAEAAVDGAYCGTRFHADAPGGLYTIRFPEPGEGNFVGAVQPTATLPWVMPWRVVMVGDDLGDIVESTMIEDLNPASKVEDTSWIKPGRVAWSWWSDHDSPQDYEKQIRFIDLAADMGWEYYLVDANWNLMDGGNVRQMARYAHAKGVGLLLWYNSGGSHNVVTEKPRGCLREPPVRQFEFELLKSWGVKGVKIDFFHSDKQNIMAYYHDILRDAAEHEILINFHGCTVPRGWSRTWPHLMTMEAVKGAECYTFAAEYPDKAPWHNTILPFTRNVVGPMDYTPCTFSDDRFPHITTNAHELALSVVFESGWLHLADEVEAYQALPPEPKDFLRKVPVAWDETRLIDGMPGQFVVIARRSGDTWYVGAINGQATDQEVAVRLGELIDGEATVELITDGDGPRTFRARQFEGNASDTVQVTMPTYGGFVMTIDGE